MYYYIWPIPNKAAQRVAKVRIPNPAPLPLQGKELLKNKKDKRMNMKAIFGSMVRTAVLTVGIVSVGFVCAGYSIADKDTELQVTHYPVVYAKVAPVIDGKLDDPIWREATPLKKFYLYENKNKPVEIASAVIAAGAITVIPRNFSPGHPL